MLLGFSPASTMLLSLSAAFGTATMLLSLSRASRNRDDAAQLVAGLDDAPQLVGGLRKRDDAAQLVAGLDDELDNGGVCTPDIGRGASACRERATRTTKNRGVIDCIMIEACVDHD